MKSCIEMAVEEAISKKMKMQSRKGLRLWNDEVTEATEEKKEHFMFLKSNRPTEEAREIYKEKQNGVKALVKQINDELRSQFKGALK